MEFPEYVTILLSRLAEAGFAAYAVGGCVRDSLLGRTPRDWDLTTDAEPEETAAVFADGAFCVTIGGGLRHGTVTVALAGDPRAACEITTFRTDGAYSDHRRPDRVTFVSRVEDDLARRDFTINAMAAAPGGVLIDPFGGQRDLAAGVIRAVGEAERRFEEDALRILRGIRFAARFGFAIEAATAAAMNAAAPLLDEIAPERIGEELRGILAGPEAGALLARFSSISQRILPGCAAGEAGTLLARTDDTAVRLALLLTPLAPEAAMSRILHLALGRTLAEDTARCLRFKDAPTDTHAALCRLAAAFGEAKLGRYLAFRRALAPAQDWEAVGTRLAALFAPGVCYNTATLAVGGRELLAAGIPAGPAVGRALAALTEAVIEERLPNEKAALLEAARRL